jgi:hypothetical protein
MSVGESPVFADGETPDTRRDTHRREFWGALRFRWGRIQSFVSGYVLQAYAKIR